MIKINRLKLDIIGYRSEERKNRQRFGFDIAFEKGLNVIKGENTSGKSTIMSCLYYGLCLEELLGGKLQRSLDKSLKNEFKNNDQLYKVHESYVFVELENSKGIVKTLKRCIKGIKNEETLIRIINGKIEASSNARTEVRTLFVHRKRNHESEVSFFKWFADFIGFKIPKVLNRDGNETRLYIQTIFPALFIEQTKGWSDFLSSMPFFGIKDNKQRTIEFILNLTALVDEVQAEKLKAKKAKIEIEWAITKNKLELLAKSNRGRIDNFPESPDTIKTNIDSINLKIKTGINSEYQSMSVLLDSLCIEKNKIDESPKNVSVNNQDLKDKLLAKENEYKKYIKAFNDFKAEFYAQKTQLKYYESHLEELHNEIEINKDVKFLTEKDPTINELEICPTCRQNIGNDLLKGKLDVELKTIKENINYLQNQENLLKSSINNLKIVLNEKSAFETYFKKDMSLLETEIKHIQKEFYDPEMLPSRSQLYEKIKLESEIQNIGYIKESFDEIKAELYNLAKSFCENKEKEKDLVSGQQEDNQKLSGFNKSFNELLIDFEYRSNNQSNVKIQSSAPFKYFPVVKTDSFPQKLQLSSSSSDFIRSIWAYTIALLLNGENHPGILLFDEPNQHSMKETSMKAFFKKLANIKDRQIIVAASIEPIESNKGVIEYRIDKLLEGIKYNEYTIEKMAIDKINE
ncbi:MAG: hypothetical protein N4A62_03125 [Marinisporobacter sp.]|jgi:DNA repair exonuclease SbcCD ATPase subunit|nr:hypothetical protein [Marinisporobacter sp.]